MTSPAASPASPTSSSPAPSALELARFAETKLEHDPFDHLVLPGFIAEAALEGLVSDFPVIDGGGSFPAASLDCRPAFRDFLAELEGPALRSAFEAKFDIDLAGRPTMVTLRGQSRAKDGRIHSDSRSKLITALIYLNRDWEHEGGRLRLLNGPDDIDDYVSEVTPLAGTLVAFRCQENAYHGHKPFVGPRASVQLNWLTEDAVLTRELSRHGFSAFLKKLTRLGR